MRPLKNPCEIAIIGAGLAGLAAARHAARLGRLVTLFEASGLYGGLVATLDEVDGLASPGRFSGQALAMHLLEDARKAGVQVVESPIVSIDLEARLGLSDLQARRYHPEALVIACGAALRRLGVAREEEFVGRGLSHCATCDGGFFRGQDVVVVGGGDGALQQALILARTSRRVVMVCRSPLRAKRDYIEKLAALENVSFVWDSEVSEILGEDGVAGVRLRNRSSGKSSTVECAGIFPLIGLTPNTGFVPPSLLTASGHVDAGSDLLTRHPGVLAVGAARAAFGGNIVQAIAEGMGAAATAALALAR